VPALIQRVADLTAADLTVDLTEADFLQEDWWTDYQ
jgi:hypothetical protein